MLVPCLHLTPPLFTRPSLTQEHALGAFKKSGECTNKLHSSLCTSPACVAGDSQNRRGAEADALAAEHRPRPDVLPVAAAQNKALRQNTKEEETQGETQGKQIVNGRQRYCKQRTLHRSREQRGDQPRRVGVPRRARGQCGRRGGAPQPGPGETKTTHGQKGN